MEILKDFQKKFSVYENIICETDSWVWSLRPHQATIGAGILSLKRECLLFSGLYQKEFTDLNKMIKIVEPVLKRVFDYDVINYLMLMMFDKQVHYHVLPRHKDKVVFMGEEWKDDNWPLLPALVGAPLEEAKLKKILNLIKKHI